MKQFPLPFLSETRNGEKSQTKLTVIGYLFVNRKRCSRNFLSHQVVDSVLQLTLNVSRIDSQSQNQQTEIIKQGVYVTNIIKKLALAI